MIKNHFKIVLGDCKIQVADRDLERPVNYHTAEKFNVDGFRLPTRKEMLLLSLWPFALLDENKIYWCKEETGIDKAYTYNLRTVFRLYDKNYVMFVRPVKDIME